MAKPGKKKTIKGGKSRDSPATKIKQCFVRTYENGFEFLQMPSSEEPNLLRRARALFCPVG